MITPSKDVLGKKVTAMTGEGTYQGHGKVTAFCDAPMVFIEPPMGLHFAFWWRLDLCKEVEK